MTIKRKKKKLIKAASSALRDSGVPFSIFDKGVRLQLQNYVGVPLFYYYPCTGALTRHPRCGTPTYTWDEVLPSDTVTVLNALKNKPYETDCNA